MEKVVKKAFGQALKQARENYKGGRLTQEKLAYESGYDRTYIHKLENGTYQPSLSAFIALSLHLGVPPATLLQAVLKEVNLK